MEQKYSTEIKNFITHEICVRGKSTSKTAAEFDIPLKTVEHWVTAYNKDPQIFKLATLPDAQKIKKLEDEVKKLREQNTILKKTLLLLTKTE